MWTISETTVGVLTFYSKNFPVFFFRHQYQKDLDNNPCNFQIITMSNCRDTIKNLRMITFYSWKMITFYSKNYPGANDFCIPCAAKQKNQKSFPESTSH